MGFVGGLLGTAGGVNGTGISGPSTANILNPTTVDQANTAYTGAQNSLAQQQAFLQATQAQNGLQNQSNVYNQLQGVVNGTGPNPAQAQLAQATGANVANQAALMAGQRGSSANTGLIARQAAQQGAQTQQQSAGQAATLQAQQSLNALSSAGSMANTQANQQQSATNAVTSAQQGEQNAVLNGIAQQNNANVGMQSNVNSANAGLASSTMSGQQNLIGNIAGSAGSAFGMAQGGKVPQPMAQGSYVQSPDLTNDQWNAVPPPPSATPADASQSADSKGPKSSVGKFFSTGNSGTKPPLTGTAQAGNVIGKGLGSALNSIFGSSASSASSDSDIPDAGEGVDAATAESDKMNAATLMPGVPQVQQQTTTDYSPDASLMGAEGGKVPVLLSPGEQKIPAKDVPAVAAGKKDPLSTGKRIPGDPKHPGNDYRNDTYKDDADPGDMIIPNEVMQGKNPHWGAMKFVQAHMMANGGRVIPKKPSKK